jgi:hypothetical protein
MRSDVMALKLFGRSLKGVGNLGTVCVPEGNGPDLKMHSHKITAILDTPATPSFLYRDWIRVSLPPRSAIAR